MATHKWKRLPSFRGKLISNPVYKIDLDKTPKLYSIQLNVEYPEVIFEIVHFAYESGVYVELFKFRLAKYSDLWFDIVKDIVHFIKGTPDIFEKLKCVQIKKGKNFVETKGVGFIKERRKLLHTFDDDIFVGESRSRKDFARNGARLSLVSDSQRDIDVDYLTKMFTYVEDKLKPGAYMAKSIRRSMIRGMFPYIFPAFRLTGGSVERSVLNQVGELHVTQRANIREIIHKFEDTWTLEDLDLMSKLLRFLQELQMLERNYKVEELTMGEGCENMNDNFLGMHQFVESIDGLLFSDMRRQLTYTHHRLEYMRLRLKDMRQDPKYQSEELKQKREPLSLFYRFKMFEEFNTREEIRMLEEFRKLHEDVENMRERKYAHERLMISEQFKKLEELILLRTETQNAKIIRNVSKLIHKLGFSTLELSNRLISIILWVLLVLLFVTGAYISIYGDTLENIGTTIHLWVWCSVILSSMQPRLSSYRSYDSSILFAAQILFSCIISILYYDEKYTLPWWYIDFDMFQIFVMQRAGYQYNKVLGFGIYVFVICTLRKLYYHTVIVAVVIVVDRNFLGWVRFKGPPSNFEPVLTQRVS
ncbi:uncharacterized protein LOC110860813 isoform X2 [Folsomia candida]|uniref:uncharacterized protein LOC110860813 isoform X2 n=1 Tax=Folsomia candida TaxID=158441 RepID=UPI001604F7B5|nr:uncharacterized protein LOC110860813 isoform X2 [Folsomia candida]